jgi:hypothetical protein
VIISVDASGYLLFWDLRNFRTYDDSHCKINKFKEHIYYTPFKKIHLTYPGEK